MRRANILCQNLFGGNVDCRGGDPLTDHHHPQSQIDNLPFNLLLISLIKPQFFTLVQTSKNLQTNQGFLSFKLNPETINISIYDKIELKLYQPFIQKPSTCLSTCITYIYFTQHINDNGYFFFVAILQSIKIYLTRRRVKNPQNINLLLLEEIITKIHL